MRKEKRQFSITAFFLLFLAVAVTTGCGSGKGRGGGAPDISPPTVSSTTPASGASGVGINSAIVATFSETLDASTIDTSTFMLSGGVTGTVTYSGTTATFTPSANLAPNATYTATITTGVRDLAGNAMTAPYTWTFTTGAAPDTTPPTVSSIIPSNGAAGVSVNAPITVTFDEAVDAALINTDTFTLSNGVMGDVSYSDKVATFTPLTPLAYNTTYTATITTGVKDLAGNAMTVPYTWSFTTAIPPANTTGTKFINSGATKTNSAAVTLSISATSSIELTGYFLSEDPTTPSASDPGWVSITPTPIYSADVSHTLSSGEGTKTIYVWFMDAAGSVSASVSGSIILSLPPAVAITSPKNLITLGSSPITVSGTIDDPNAVVTVNGVPVSLSNGIFSISGITLNEGMNTIVARAIDPDNNVSTASINISLDSTPPHIAITSPPDGYVATASPITVGGIINDIVRGTVNENQGRVLVNGMEATVANRTFSVVDVPLNPGVNTITAVGADQVGNTVTTSITVNLDLSANARINLYSGDIQSGAIGNSLAEPLVVYLNDDNGAPAPGVSVIFRVIENNGTLNGGERAIAVTSDANGLASANYTLGTWAGSGNNRVEVKAVGFVGSVIFTASGTQKPPASIYVAQGSQQRGAINQSLPEPLVAFVTDEGHNPLGNIPVLFKAVEGSGKFANGLDNISVDSDSDGRASVAFTLGPTAGNDSNIMEATFEGNIGPPASFTATALIPGDPGNTKISGVVLDNSNTPIPNVTVRVEGTSREAKTDANGHFVIDNVPVGPVHLIADGSTAGTPGVIEYPTLMYELTTIAGADNSIGMPIYLLPLDLANAKWVGGNEDVTYSIPSIPGFSLTIRKNSVTFPDGRKQGLISVTQVHADKVPMVPQIGQQPRFIITIQPPGAIFDPPAPITLPNVDGLAPGEKTNMYSFDHDLGIFVSIGTGTVSEDGLALVSDPGVGVVKAGWHCGGNPATTGSANNCPECQICVNNRCVPAGGGACTDEGDKCTSDVCITGSCAHIPTLVGANECCNPNTGNVVPKNPISDLSECPNRVANPNWTYEYDGCTNVPDNPTGCPDTLFSNYDNPPGNPNPSGPCDFHDRCYQTCYSPQDYTSGSARYNCDYGMYTRMVEVCDDATSACAITNYLQCLSWASVYFDGLRLFGGGAFDDRQQSVCNCCP